ncbi:hypothetical protein P3S67_014063 [Capsicum chacoense]
MFGKDSSLDNSRPPCITYGPPNTRKMQIHVHRNDGLLMTEGTTQWDYVVHISPLYMYSFMESFVKLHDEGGHNT